MPDYKEMYLTMVRASEDAINTLIQAQRKCEDLYLNAPEPDIRVLDTSSPGRYEKGRLKSRPFLVYNLLSLW